jgi:hypothetical protein
LVFLKSQFAAITEPLTSLDTSTITNSACVSNYEDLSKRIHVEVPLNCALFIFNLKTETESYLHIFHETSKVEALGCRVVVAEGMLWDVGISPDIVMAADIQRTHQNQEKKTTIVYTTLVCSLGTTCKE